jgi:hypothetical protein
LLYICPTLVKKDTSKTRFMKKIFIFVFLLISFYSQSQTYIKGNAVTALVLVPNFGVETNIGKKSTFQFDVLASFWSSVNGVPREFCTITPEYRYFFKEKFNGFYVGGHIGGSIYNVQKWGPVYEGSDYREEGIGYFVGATIGYEKKLNDRFMLDFFIGGGTHQAFYKGYYISTGERYDDDVENYNRSGDWLPYRGGLMISYRIN